MFNTFLCFFCGAAATLLQVLIKPSDPMMTLMIGMFFGFISGLISAHRNEL